MRVLVSLLAIGKSLMASLAGCFALLILTCMVEEDNLLVVVKGARTIDVMHELATFNRQRNCCGFRNHIAGHAGFDGALSFAIIAWHLITV